MALERKQVKDLKPKEWLHHDGRFKKIKRVGIGPKVTRLQFVGGTYIDLPSANYVLADAFHHPYDDSYYGGF